jgi:hypothetical protein
MIYFLTGLILGLASALAGAWISYRTYVGGGREASGRPLGYLLIVTLTLVGVGAVALVVGAMNDMLDRAILTGVGVFIGFTVAFGVTVYIGVRGEGPASPAP